MNTKIVLTGILALGLTNANAQKQDTLVLFREKINQLDQQIVHLLGERMKAAKTIGEYKMTHKMEVLQSNRFNEVLQKAVNTGKAEGLSEEFIKAVYESIHKESIRHQESLKR